MTTAVKPSSSLILSASFLASPPIFVLREESLSKTLTACDAWHLRSDKHQRSLFLTAGVSWQVQLLSAHGLSSAKRKKKEKKKKVLIFTLVKSSEEATELMEIRGANKRKTRKS